MDPNMQPNPGNDIGAPPQNPVPTAASTPKQRAYQQDPFATEDTAQVSYGGGRAQTVAGAGFRTPKPKWQTDPFSSDFDPNKFKSKFTTDEDFKETGEYDQYWEAYESDTGGYQQAEDFERDPTRLDAFKETGEITSENISDIYSLKEDELADYGIDIHAENVGNAPPGITSGWNDADGDGYDDDGHAYGTHGAVNVPTLQGDMSIDSVLADPSQGLNLGPGEDAGLLDKGKHYLNKGLDMAEGFAQPKNALTSWGDEFQTGPGGAVSAALPGPLGALAGIGGAISKANLEKIHGKYGDYSTGDGMGVIPKEAIPGVTTPLAVSEGFIGGTTVISGNTDLALQQNPSMDLNGDGDLSATELQGYMKQQESLQAARAEQERAAAEAKRIEDDRLRAIAEQQAKARLAEQERRNKAAAEAQKRREEKERAQAEAKAQEDARRAEAQRRANETGRDQTYGGGSAVTDRHGRAVRSGSDGSVVTDRQVTVRAQRNDDSGGGGGDSCFAKGTSFKMADGSLKAIEDIKVGDIMEKGGRVYGVLQGDGSICDWYRYGDSYVTGSHFVKERGKWMPIWKSKKAEAMLFDGFDIWYCVLNVKHLMVAGDKAVFTDFDAVDSVNDELEERLNAVQKR